MPCRMNQFDLREAHSHAVFARVKLMLSGYNVIQAKDTMGSLNAADLSRRASEPATAQDVVQLCLLGVVRQRVTSTPYGSHGRAP